MLRAGVGRNREGGGAGEDETERIVRPTVHARNLTRRVWDVRSRGGHASVAPTTFEGFSAGILCHNFNEGRAEPPKWHSHLK